MSLSYDELFGNQFFFPTDHVTLKKNVIQKNMKVILNCNNI